MINEGSLDACEEESVTPQHNNNNVPHAKEKVPSGKGGPPKRPEVSDAVRSLLEQRRSSKETVEKAAVEAARAKEKQQMVRDDAFLLPLAITSPDARRHSTAADALSCAKQYSKLRLSIPQRDAAGEVTDLSHTDSESDLCNLSYPFAKSSPRLMRASWSSTGTGYTESNYDKCMEVPHTAPVIASKPDGFRLAGKVNRKLKHCLKVAAGWRNDKELSMESEVDSSAPGKPKSHEIKVIDLTSDDLEASPSVHKLTYAEFLALGTS